MKKLLFLIAMIVVLEACSKVLVTGRRQLNLLPDSEMSALSLQSYNEFMSTATVSTDAKNTALINEVGRKITRAVEQFLRNNGEESEIKNYNWSFTLVKSNEVNAFCLPGGQIVFYEGILPYTQGANGVATVMGHEIAHAIAKHSNERVSQQMAIQYGSQLTGILTQNTSAVAQTAINTLYGVGTELGVALPYSRKQESEADELGLIFMAMAGYDPHEALSFWQRMSAGNSAQVTEILSTHPSDANRIEKIQKWLPEAMKYYNP